MPKEHYKEAIRTIQKIETAWTSLKSQSNKIKIKGGWGSGRGLYKIKRDKS